MKKIKTITISPSLGHWKRRRWKKTCLCCQLAIRGRRQWSQSIRMRQCHRSSKKRSRLRNTITWSANMVVTRTIVISTTTYTNFLGRSARKVNKISIGSRQDSMKNASNRSSMAREDQSSQESSSLPCLASLNSVRRVKRTTGDLS